MKQYYSFALLCAATFSFCSCGNSTTMQDNAEPLTFDNFQVCDTTTDTLSPEAKFDIHIDLTYATGGDGAEAINDSLLNLCFFDDNCEVNPEMNMEEKIKAKVENFKAVYQDDYKSMAEGNTEPPQFSYYLDIRGNLSFSSDSTWVYTLKLETYLGGAHGSCMISVMNIDKRTGKMFGVQDILKSGYETDLSNAIVKKMAEDFKVNGLEGLKEMGIFDMMEPCPAQNCICSQDSLTFIYNQYEIAPYCIGTITTTIAKSDIKDLLN